MGAPPGPAQLQQARRLWQWVTTTRRRKRHPPNFIELIQLSGQSRELPAS
jgi:hypothetical protein